jgi:pyruvate/2-oxoglutarate dehydrogenase complex dihydrolipoamide dehydrogenase (E3) component
MLLRLVFSYLNSGGDGAASCKTRASRAGIAVLGRHDEAARFGRAIEKGETHGFMKIIVDADSSEILGAAILGIGGDETIHSILDIMYAKQPYTVIQRAMHIHPTVSELIPTMLSELETLH